MSMVITKRDRYAPGEVHPYVSIEAPDEDHIAEIAEYLATEVEGIHGVELDRVEKLVEVAWTRYNLKLEDCRRVGDPEGSEARPCRDPKTEEHWEDFEPSDEDDGFEGWEEDHQRWWDDYHSKGKGNPGTFRDGSGVYKDPVKILYHTVNCWWRRYVRKEFCPDFGGLNDDDSARAALDMTPADRAPMLKDDARLLLMVANEIDTRILPLHLGRVHYNERTNREMTIPSE